MILVLDRGVTEQHVSEVLAELRGLGLEGRPVRAGDRSVVHIVRGPTRRALALVRLPRVAGIVPTSGPRVRRAGRRFYPYHFVGWSAAALLLMGVLVALAGFLPPGLGQEASSLASADAEGWPEWPGPWYLRAMRRSTAVLPGGWSWILWLAVLVLLLLLPRLDRGGRGGLRGRLPVLLPAGALLLVLLCLVLP